MSRTASNQATTGQPAWRHRLMGSVLWLGMVGVLLLGSALAQSSVQVSLNRGTISAFAPVAASGFSSLDLANNRSEDAIISVYRLKDDTSLSEFTAASEALADATEANRGIHAALDQLDAQATALGGLSVSKNSSKTMLVDLQRGTYAVVAAPKSGGDIVVTTFQVAGHGPSDAEGPQVANVVNFSDFAFEFPKKVTAGVNLWRVNNVGTQPHVADFYRLRPGHTVDDLLAYLGGETSGRAPYDKTASIEMVAEGETVYVPVDLEAGNWVALCLVPDMDHPELTHVMEGMVANFRVF